MSRRKMQVGAALVLAVVGGLAVRHFTRSAAAQAAGSRAALDAPAQVPVASPRAAVVVTHTENVTMTVHVSDETMAALGSSLTGHLGRATTAENAIAEARAGRIDAIELGNRLRGALAGHPELGYGLLKELVAERSPVIAMQMAQALATVEDDEELRRQTVDALRSGPPEARAVGLLALMGRGEPEALDLAAESFVQDSAEARATAGFLLNNAPDGLDGQLADEALAAARGALADSRTSARLREEATTLLGRQDATDADVALLERLASNGDEAARARALAALEATGADRARVMAAFERVTHEDNAPEQLALMAKAYVGTRR